METRMDRVYTFIARYLVPKFLRQELYYRDIKDIRLRYGFRNPAENIERLKAQRDAVDYWRV